MMRNGGNKKGAVRHEVEELISKGMSLTDIAITLGCSEANVAYHKRMLGHTSKYKLYNWNEIRQYYESGHSATECVEHFGIRSFDTWKKAIRRGLIVVRPNIKLYEFPRKMSSWRLGKKLVKLGILDYKCAVCGISEWQDKHITLEADHINGVRIDNRPENIRLLCPNCHSQTDTYRSRNIKFRRKLLETIDLGL